MDLGRLVFAVIGFSTSFFLCLPNLKKWQAKQITREKLKMVNEALGEAEERVRRCEERHDRILGLICSFYLSNQDLDQAMAAAREALKEAVEFASGLRGLKMEIISSYYSNQS
ncbi:hypothetical protein NMG60_11032204 [Bertholletia excelsa]